jgi:radical SAM superfamily enzyme YgiQ (UPF0313 family)
MRIAIGDPANIGNVMVAMGNHRFPNMGVLSLFSYLREHRDGVELLYLKGDLSLQAYLDRLDAFQFDVYGISFASWVSTIAYETIAAVKKRFPGRPVICGGTHPTALPEEVLSNSMADVCVIGEGEETLVELLGFYDSGTPALSGIPGIAYRKDGAILRSAPRKHMEDLGSLPLPAWDLIEFDEYEGMGYCKARPNTAMIFSRGCPHNCVYCSNPVWRSSKPWLRVRPPGEIEKEIHLLYERGIREIWIRADEFNSDLDWAMEVCEAIRKLNYSDLYFECNLRVDKVTDGLARALRDANVWMVNLGVESLNQRVLDGIRKRTSVDQILQSCRILKAHQIDVYAWLMYYQIWEKGGELCWESPEEVDHTLKEVRRMARAGLIDLISWQMATPIPGADMFEVAKRHGLVSEPYQYDVWKVGLRLPGISERKIQIHRLRGMLLQASLAYRKGRVGWATRGNILGRMKYMLDAALRVVHPSSS